MNSSKTLLYTVLISTLLLIAGYIFFINYIYGLSGKTILKKQDLDITEIKLKNLSNIDKVSKENISQKEFLSSLFLKKNQTIEFVSFVESTAQGFDLAYKTMSIGLNTPGNLEGKNKEILQMVMSVDGSWANVFRFIKYIENMPYIVKFNRLNLNNNQGSWSATLSFEVVKDK
jgi:Tfp pilus assembly protein PilO